MLSHFVIQLLALSAVTVLCASATPFISRENEAKRGGKIKPKVFIISMVSSHNQLNAPNNQ